MTLCAVRITTLEQAQTLRVIRNATRDGYSQFNDEITPEQQAAWWAEQGLRVRGWLYKNGQHEAVGFGLLRRDELGRWCTVVGVLPAQAGHGYGKEITADLVCRCEGRCYATARLDNPAAVKLHTERFWARASGPDGRLAYFRGIYASGPEARLMTGWGVGRR